MLCSPPYFNYVRKYGMLLGDSDLLLKVFILLGQLANSVVHHLFLKTRLNRSYTYLLNPLLHDQRLLELVAWLEARH